MDNFLNKLFGLKDKVVVVTGGAGLIGERISSYFAETGSIVYIADLSKDKAEEIVEKLTKCNLNVKFIELDITSEQSVENAIKHIFEKEKKIDVWINSAYPRTSDWGAKFEDIKLDSWRKNIDMHMNGYFLCMQKVVEVMKRQNSGSIINFGSIYGVVAPTFSIYEGTEMTSPAAYSAIKGGIINLTRYLASYVGKHNIRVNAICPGGVYDGQNPSFVMKYNANNFLGRMASPDDIAGTALFLASEASSYITGQTIMVDGGWTVH